MFNNTHHTTTYVSDETIDTLQVFIDADDRYAVDVAHGAWCMVHGACCMLHVANHMSHMAALESCHLSISSHVHTRFSCHVSS